MSVSSTLSEIAAQFNSDPSRDFFIAQAGTRVSRTAFSFNADLAQALMAAHMMTLRDLGTKAGGLALGALTSIKEGDLTLTMKATVDKRNSDLSTTVYGKWFLQLQVSSVLPLGVTGAKSFLAPAPTPDDC